MNKIAMRVSLAAAGAAVLGLIMAPATLADIGCTISNNGANSHNTCTVRVNGGSGLCRRLACTASGSAQTNSANVTNNITVHSNTGHNSANNNTGTSSATINTGSS